EVRQVLAALVDEHAPVQAVLQRAQIRQAKRPYHEAGRRRAARRQRNGVLLTELSDLVREQQQVRQAAFTDGVHFGSSAFDHIAARRAAAGLGETRRQGLLHQLRQLLLAQLARRLQAEEQARPEWLRADLREPAADQRQAEAAALGDLDAG